MQNSFLRKRLKDVAPFEVNNLSPAPKRKRREASDSSDEDANGNYDENSELNDSRRLLQRERQQRQFLEDKIRTLEAKLNDSEQLNRISTRKAESEDVRPTSADNNVI